MTKEQDIAMARGHKILKATWPKDNLQISLNLAKNHNNVNYNIKQSGILNLDLVLKGQDE